MNFKFITLISISISVSQVLGVLTGEQQHAQYANEKFNIEAEVFRMRCYAVALETNYSVKKINQQIIQKMTTIGVPMENIEDLKLQLRDKGRSIDNHLLLIMDAVRKLRSTLTDIFTDIETDLTQIPLDEALMHGDVSGVNNAYTQSNDYIDLTMEYMTLKFEIELVGFSGPEADEIKALIAEANNLMGDEQVKVKDSKVLFDQRHVVARDTLHALTI